MVENGGRDLFVENPVVFDVENKISFGVGPDTFDGGGEASGFGREDGGVWEIIFDERGAIIRIFLAAPNGINVNEGARDLEMAEKVGVETFERSREQGRAAGSDDGDFDGWGLRHWDAAVLLAKSFR